MVQSMQDYVEAENFTSPFAGIFTSPLPDLFSYCTPCLPSLTAFVSFICHAVLLPRTGRVTRFQLGSLQMSLICLKQESVSWWYMTKIIPAVFIITIHLL